jgi:PAS domain S-box-containing protein
MVDEAEHEHTDQALRELEQRYRALVEQSLVGVFEVRGGRIKYVNAALARLYGYTSEELQAMEDPNVLVHPDDLPLIAENRRERRPGAAQEASYACRIVRRDGEILHVEVHANVLPDDPLSLNGVVIDVTKRVHAEEAVRVSEQRLRAVVGSALDAVITMDDAGTIVGWAGRAEAIFGWSSEEVVGKLLAEVVVPVPQRAAHQRGLARFLATGETRAIGRRLELSALRRDGREFPVELTVSHLQLKERSLFSAFVRDLTERKATEAALREADALLQQSQRMEAVGRLAGGVAHDFNNLLTVIGYSAESLLEGIDPHAPLYGDALEIKETSKRAAELTRQLLAFSRRRPVQPRYVKVDAVVRQSERMLGRLLGEKISFEIELEQNLPEIFADPGQLDQVLVNLALNAADAMPSGGRIALSAGLVDVAASSLETSAGVPAGRWVVLSVRDNGHGMDAATRARVFEPFFTTKPSGKGTGLGLATVFGIVKQAGGHVLVDSEPGVGSVFRVFLPVSAPHEVSEHKSMPAPAVGGSERVLLVEDDPQVRRVARRDLERLGYRVFEAGCGADALKAAKAGAPIDIVVSDVVLPDFDGPEVVRAVLAMYPRAAALFMSGYTGDDPLHRRVIESGVSLVEKPFSLDSLGRAVRLALASPRRVGQPP